MVCGILAACMCAGMAGCGVGGDLDTPNADDPVPAPAPSETKAPKDLEKPDKGMFKDLKKGQAEKDQVHDDGGDSPEDDEAPGDGGGQPDDGSLACIGMPVVEDFASTLVAFCAPMADGRSYLISPTSFRAALCLAIAGAGGETRDSLLATAGFDSMDEMEAWYGALMASVADFQVGLLPEEEATDGIVPDEPAPDDVPDGTSEPVSGFGSYDPYARDGAYKILNSVWNNTDLQGRFLDGYLDYVSGTLGAAAYEKPAAELTDAINAWADDATNGLIPELGPDFSSAAAVLANAVYLRSGWQDEFSEGLTADEPFHLADGSEKTMPMMHDSGKYMYAETDAGRFLVKSLEGNKHLVVQLGGGEICNPKDFLDAIPHMDRVKVELTMPKLDMEMSWSHGELLQYLKDYGSYSATHPDYADFLQMCDGDWYVDDIVQKTRLKTDEEGLEAAAVTGMQMAMSAMEVEEDEPVEFRMDEPFSFVVLDGSIWDYVEDGPGSYMEVLFAGRYNGIDAAG